MYVVGLLPARPLMEPLPMHHAFLSVFVNDQGTTVEYVDAPEPWFECEAQHLHHHGVIDRNELRRHRRWIGHKWCTSRVCLLDY